MYISAHKHSRQEILVDVSCVCGQVQPDSEVNILDGIIRDDPVLLMECQRTQKDTHLQPDRLVNLGSV